jgi:glucose-1-phosphate cytidylyltransferase|tara:strand:- start:21165 stop:21932 length:768 start_codon:yes stop_codon:yes gene_type:complete
MKIIILAGGLGTRLAEETHLRPKPMVEIGGRPIVWHLMNVYADSGFNEFVLALGYKGEVIKDFFLNYHALNGDVSVDLSNGNAMPHKSDHPDWTVHLIDTGLKTMTGGRIKRLKDFVGNETFMVTYADGLADIDINALLEFHRSHGKLATVTTVPPPSRFGNLEIENNKVISFNEKPEDNEGLINGGYFVFEPAVFDYIEGDETSLEREPLERLAKDEQLMAYEHKGFWQMMDTVLEKQLLEKLLKSGNPPWRRK